MHHCNRWWRPCKEGQTEAAFFDALLTITIWQSGVNWSCTRQLHWGELQHSHFQHCNLRSTSETVLTLTRWQSGVNFSCTYASINNQHHLSLFHSLYLLHLHQVCRSVCKVEICGVATPAGRWSPASTCTITLQWKLGRLVLHPLHYNIAALMGVS